MNIVTIQRIEQDTSLLKSLFTNLFDILNSKPDRLILFSNRRVFRSLVVVIPIVCTSGARRSIFSSYYLFFATPPSRQVGPLRQQLHSNVHPLASIIQQFSVIATMMRLPTIVTLFLAAASAVMSAAAADIREDADALSQSTFLRGAGSDAGIHQYLLRAIEADELGEFDSSGLTLVRMNCKTSYSTFLEIYSLLTFSPRPPVCCFLTGAGASIQSKRSRAWTLR